MSVSHRWILQSIILNTPTPTRHLPTTQTLPTTRTLRIVSMYLWYYSLFEIWLCSAVQNCSNRQHLQVRSAFQAYYYWYGFRRRRLMSFERRRWGFTPEAIHWVFLTTYCCNGRPLYSKGKLTPLFMAYGIHTSWSHMAVHIQLQEIRGIPAFPGDRGLMGRIVRVAAGFVGSK